MVNIRNLDPSASPLDYYGAELRRLREAAGLNQGQLGGVVYCTGSLIGQIETAKKVPTRRFSEQLDAALMTGGTFSRLVGLVLKSQLPTWFQPYADLEARATYISTFQAQLVYGLLQTDAYARAVLGARTEDDLDAKVEARIDRQRILDRETPPLIWVILGEAVLHQEIGGKQVMREQLAHLLRIQEREWVKIQILPFSAGAHAGLPGSFTMLRFEDDPDLVYTEDFVRGHMTADPAAFREGSLRYDHLRAAALSVEKSVELIARVMEERYADRPEPDGRALA
ncbi:MULTISPECIES: helix-turn-helix domain-containing protein [Streptomyces]|uniref:XRE family transcriptional regulator n=1 Tax=Streptomyces cinereoruber TaxID=67260 RepID=A0ABX6BR88_9ACTN|nr:MULTISPECIES: helix-turn-helix transcriptional regulator [Streptomyces]MBB4156062.1 transcriptional regulator with XRE-family HTH domain [Streptomyces cinereoruber]MBY8819564.1 helix-turn-helix domain-containing protein [Streptomyces cinereoruber]NIH64873.1 transcriptional regulator with XRE-family HTH domain [Streptomyces cinereoruber]PVC72042.1 transcriptional regulator [Streptomyces sp. CS081A]QEV36750.1 XRE family transcriptional regulator [Streptomyces cinereoruber]